MLFLKILLNCKKQNAEEAKKIGAELHIDKECNRAFINLMDTIAMFDRTTGRRYTIVLVPENSDEPTKVLHSSSHLPVTMDPIKAIEMAIYRRNQT